MEHYFSLLLVLLLIIAVGFLLCAREIDSFAGLDFIPHFKELDDEPVERRVRERRTNTAPLDREFCLFKDRRNDKDRRGA